MELVLVRHAQPAWVVDGIGYNDPNLSELGRAQAEAVGLALADLEVDEFWVSPAARSQQTAEAIVGHHDVSVVTHDWALEIQLPTAWDEAPVEQVREHFATLGDRDRAGWWEATAPHGGESFRDFHQRVTTGLEGQLAEHGIKDAGEPDLWHVPDDDRQRICLVTHAGTNSVVVGHLLGVSPQPWEWERFSSAHASISVVQSRPIASAHLLRLRSFSETAHLTTAGCDVTR
ncbi:histidine phosphatase family protein [Salsipaludibacter albus]|uniref:histidine phosphatase family protein n=1 Tax=Salsipaludibacter albus TaxID=2849650 RepID=UPI001EE4CFB6|nr:histidine phosphatase family protein [Salsipaludibacter albus]MBY5161041.1 histidine phosphatase family protein [Salsipaludibacter albus]